MCSRGADPEFQHVQRFSLHVLVGFVYPVPRNAFALLGLPGTPFINAAEFWLNARGMSFFSRSSAFPVRTMFFIATPESRWDGFVRFRNLIGISSYWRLLNRPRFAEMHTRAKKCFRLFHVLRVQDSLGFNESRVTHHSCEDFRRSGSIPDSGIPGFEGIGFAVTPARLG